MTKITVDKALIEQAIAAMPDRIGVSRFALRQKLRAALAEPAVEPVGVVVDYILQDDIHNRLTPRVVDIAYSAFMRGSSGTRSDDDGPCDWFNDTKPMVMKQIAKIKKDLAEAAAPVREPAPEKKGLFVDLIAEHPGLAAELAAMDVPALVQEPEHYTVDAVAWEGFLHDYGKYVDGHVKYPFSAVRESLAAVIDSAEAAQPRKAVKLSDSEILTALDVEYVSSAQNRELFLSDARTIEQAVWAKLGVSE